MQFSSVVACLTWPARIGKKQSGLIRLRQKGLGRQGTVHVRDFHLSHSVWGHIVHSHQVVKKCSAVAFLFIFLDWRHAMYEIFGLWLVFTSIGKVSSFQHARTVWPLGLYYLDNTPPSPHNVVCYFNIIGYVYNLCSTNFKNWSLPPNPHKSYQYNICTN